MRDGLQLDERPDREMGRPLQQRCCSVDPTGCAAMAPTALPPAPPPGLLARQTNEPHARAEPQRRDHRLPSLLPSHRTGDSSGWSSAFPRRSSSQEAPGHALALRAGVPQPPRQEPAGKQCGELTAKACRAVLGASALSGDTDRAKSSWDGLMAWYDFAMACSALASDSLVLSSHRCTARIT